MSASTGWTEVGYPDRVHVDEFELLIADDGLVLDFAGRVNGLDTKPVQLKLLLSHDAMHHVVEAAVTALATAGDLSLPRLMAAARAGGAQ